MHLNYYFLKHLAEALDKTLPGHQIKSIYSQEKEELIIATTDGQAAFFIKAYLTSAFSCLSFPHVHHRAKKNSVNLFESIYGQSITNVKVVHNDRSFYMQFESGAKLIFKMHGGRSNIILAKPEVENKVFKHSLVRDLAASESNLEKVLDQSRDAFLAANKLSEVFPTFGPRIKRHLTIIGFDQAAKNEQWAMIAEVLAQLNRPKFRIGLEDNKPYISLLPLENAVEEYADPVLASNRLFQLYTQHYLLSVEKKKISKKLESAISKTKSYVQKSRQKLSDIQNRRSYEEIANLIMANLHEFKNSAQSVNIHDFYLDRPISIKVKPGMSPQKLAENYYRKAKNKALETKNLNDNISRKLLLLEELSSNLDAIESIVDHRQLDKFVKAHEPSNTHSDPESRLPFHKHYLGGYEILVGKTAKDNDEMLRRHSAKDDIWLHARDVAGSHVLIKTRKGSVVPEDVLECAAQLAAFHSKRKQDSLSPVIYTPRKYVRKGKNLPPGQVLVEKESVIIVAPNAKPTVPH